MEKQSLPMRRLGSAWLEAADGGKTRRRADERKGTSGRRAAEKGKRRPKRIVNHRVAQCLMLQRTAVPAAHEVLRRRHWQSACRSQGPDTAVRLHCWRRVASTGQTARREEHAEHVTFSAAARRIRAIFAPTQASTRDYGEVR